MRIQHGQHGHCNRGVCIRSSWRPATWVLAAQLPSYYWPCANATMYQSRTDVRIPAGLGVGQVIGKQGSNIKHLQTRCGARMSVDTNDEKLIVSGSATAVSLALRLLEAQFASWRSSGQLCGKCVMVVFAWQLQVKSARLRARRFCLVIMGIIAWTGTVSADLWQTPASCALLQLRPLTHTQQKSDTS